MLIKVTALSLAAAALFTAVPASAAPGATANGYPALTVVIPASVDTLSEPTETSSAEFEIVSEDALSELRGGETLVVGNQTLTAITTGNVINGNYVAGTVSLSDAALSNFSGLGNLLINTGAQNSIQSGMNVVINVGE
jgi:hypothetical protein